MVDGQRLCRHRNSQLNAQLTNDGPDVQKLRRGVTSWLTKRNLAADEALGCSHVERPHTLQVTCTSRSSIVSLLAVGTHLESSNYR